MDTQPKTSKSSMQKKLLVKLLTEGKILDINNLTACWPYYTFMGCPECGIRYPIREIEDLKCPVCAKKTIFVQVTKGMFHTWLNSGHTPKLDFDILSRRAEHEISYNAKRAIQNFISIRDWYHNWDAFLKGAWFLCEGEIQQCKYLLQEYLMIASDDCV